MSLRRVDSEEHFDKLAHSVIESKDWKWLPGMLLNGYDAEGKRLSARTKRTRLCEASWEASGTPRIAVGVGWLPDLEDAATLGCLLTLARESLGQPRLAALAAIYRLQNSLGCR